MPVAKRYLACGATIVVMVAGLVAHAAAPAQAAFDTAQANLVTRVNGQYQALSYSLAEGDNFTAGNVNGATRLAWSHPGFNGSWNLELLGPARAPLAAGTYERAMSGFGSEWFRPGMSLSGSTSCQGNGRFVINKIEFGGDGVVSKLDVYFEQDCGNTGTIGRLVLGLPLPDAAPASGPAVLFATSTAADPAAIRLFARVPAGVESMVARVSSLETGLEVGRVDVFTRDSGTDSLGAWTAGRLTSLGEAGFYRIDTDITDLNGAQVSQTNIGYLAYAARAEFATPKAEPDRVNFTRRTTTVRGMLTSRQPGSGQNRPIAGASLSVLMPSHHCACPDDREAKVAGTGVTAEDGSYAIPVSVDRTTSVFVVYQGNSPAHITGGESGQVSIWLDQVTTNLSGPSAFWGPTATISGVLTYTPSYRASARPVPDARLELLRCNVSGGCGTVATSRTDAQGRYSFTHTQSFGEGSVKVVAVPTDPFLSQASWEIYHAAYEPGVSIESFGGYWASEHGATFVGEVTFTGSPAARRPIAIQVQTDSGWRTVRVANPIEYVEGWFFDITLGPPCGVTIWRATYGPGDEVVSDLLRVDKGCMGPVRPPVGGGGGTLPPQR